MDKMQLMLGTATVVFTVGAALVLTPVALSVARDTVRWWRVRVGGPALRWVTVKASAAANWIDDSIERVFGGVRGFIDADRIDWDAVALGAGATEAPLGQCPECFGQPGASLRAENAILRANATAGRAELQTLRHQVAMLNDTVAAADRRIAEITASAVESAREVERLLRERSMSKLTPTVRGAVKRTAARAVPGTAMGDA